MHDNTLRNALMIGLAAVALACGGGGKDAGSGEGRLGNPTDGARVFAEYCAGCHGAAGEGDIGPALAEEVPEHSDEQLAAVILEGEDEMPAIDLNADQLTDVLAYLRQQFGAHEGGGEHDEHDDDDDDG